jgi:hypothetical protein
MSVAGKFACWGHIRGQATRPLTGSAAYHAPHPPTAAFPSPRCGYSRGTSRSRAVRQATPTVSALPRCRLGHGGDLLSAVLRVVAGLSITQGRGWVRLSGHDRVSVVELTVRVRVIRPAPVSCWSPQLLPRVRSSVLCAHRRCPPAFF